MAEDNRRLRPLDDSPNDVGGAPAVGSPGSGSSDVPSPAADAGASSSVLPPSADAKSGSDLPAVPDSGPDSPTLAEAYTPGSARTPVPSRFFGEQPTLESGTILAGRYEILEMLGEGGMGAVYKARDRELTRTVALKVIRPDLVRNPAVIERFKQELRLSHQVTHKNVIRIYDLGEGEGVKFITMEYIEGKDLRSLIREKKKFTPDETVNVLHQVCEAVDAAHSVGVIHRDLKPQNIMQDGSGRVLVMDFGLARTLQGDGMTQTGALVGTVEYMSPEQALGKQLDQRSDIFALGLIFYELLTGNKPFVAESDIASLIKRTQERATPVSDVDGQIPGALSGIVSKCLEREPAARFASIQELIEEVEIWQGKRTPSGRAIVALHKATQTVAFLPERRFPWKWIGVGMFALVLAAGTYLGVRRWMQPSAGESQGTQEPVTSLAVIPFHNDSGDPSLDWLSSSLSENLSTDIGQSAHLPLVSPGRLQQVLHDLHISPQSQLDPSELKRIAEFTNADTVVYGQYAKFGDRIRVNSTVNDLKNDRQYHIATEVDSNNDMLAGLNKLADELRQKLASSPEILKELRSQTPFVMTQSVPALRAYNEGLQLSRSGQYQDAAKKFEDAVTEDPNFAMGYSKLALSYHSLGSDDRAEQASRRAVTLSDNLPTQEKYLIDASHDVIMNDTAAAISAYEKLTLSTPNDADAQFMLAGLYEQVSNYDEARKRLTRIRSVDSKNVDVLLASGRVEIEAGNPPAGLEFLNSAYILATQFGSEETKASIEIQLGHAYQALNKLDEALKNYTGALEIRRKLGLEKGVASSLNNIANLQVKLGNSSEALTNYKASLAAYQHIGDKHGTALILMNMGSYYADYAQYEDALKSTNDALMIFRDLGEEENQAQCLNNLGAIHGYIDNIQDALTSYQQSYQIRERLKLTDDMAESLQNLASTNVDLGQYDAAVNQYLKALEIRRNSGDQNGMAINSSGLGDLFTLQGKYGSALSALQQSLKEFQQTNDHTWLMVEARGRYGNTLSEVGRWDEGQKSLEDALKLAIEIKNNTILHNVLDQLGDSYFYRGVYGIAGKQYEKALQVATKLKSRGLLANSRFNLAKLDVVQGRSASAIPVLRKQVAEFDSLGLKAGAVQSSIYLAEALLATKKPAEAQQELDRTMKLAGKLGLLVEQARAHYLMGQALDKLGKSNQAAPQYREAVRILESISKEDGASHISDRSDLKDIYIAAKSPRGGM
jgi:serine/threonine protein kinase/tetratricopeptide (TPR) repeat protein